MRQGYSWLSSAQWHRYGFGGVVTVSTVMEFWVSAKGSWTDPDVILSHHPAHATVRCQGHIARHS